MSGLKIIICTYRFIYCYNGEIPHMYPHKGGNLFMIKLDLIVNLQQVAFQFLMHIFNILNQLTMINIPTQHAIYYSSYS